VTLAIRLLGDLRGAGRKRKGRGGKKEEKKERGKERRSSQYLTSRMKEGGRVQKRKEKEEKRKEKACSPETGKEKKKKGGRREGDRGLRPYSVSYEGKRSEGRKERGKGGKGERKEELCAPDSPAFLVTGRLDKKGKRNKKKRGGRERLHPSPSEKRGEQKGKGGRKRLALRFQPVKKSTKRKTGERKRKRALLPRVLLARIG